MCKVVERAADTLAYPERVMVASPCASFVVAGPFEGEKAEKLKS
jgi:hypothetical protein